MSVFTNIDPSAVATETESQVSRDAYKDFVKFVCTEAYVIAYTGIGLNSYKVYNLFDEDCIKRFFDIVPVPEQSKFLENFKNLSQEENEELYFLKLWGLKPNVGITSGFISWELRHAMINPEFLYIENDKHTL